MTVVEVTDPIDPSEGWVVGSWIFFCSSSNCGDDGVMTQAFLLLFDLTGCGAAPWSASKFLKLGAMLFCIAISFDILNWIIEFRIFSTFIFTLFAFN
jgi:hypothetical protein